MNLNIKEFQELLKKGTLNYTIDSIGLHFTKDKVKCNMISRDRQALLFLNLPNNTITDMTNEEIELNFNEPNSKVKPYVSIIDDEEVPLKVTDEMIKIDKKVKINFDHPDTISTYGKDNPITELEFFKETPVTEEFILNFDKIKKVGNKFGKVYFIVENNKLFIESTDKLNKFSNSVKFPVCDVKHDDVIMCFSSKNMVSLMGLVGVDFVFKFCYVEENGLGCIACFNKDKSERYYLMSLFEE